MTKYVIATILAFMLPGLSAGTFAAANEMEDVEKYTCKQIMRLDGNDREGAIAFLHGYLIGQSKSSSFGPEKKSEATDKFTDTCLDNPSRKAVDVLRSS